MNTSVIQSLTLFLSITLSACSSGSSGDGKASGTDSLANVLEESLFSELLELWYPRNIDSVNGGYISGLNRDFTPVERPQRKVLVQQARHVWATSFIYEHYPEREEYLKYAGHGFRFLKDRMWDSEFGGFYTAVEHDGTPATGGMSSGKRIYGQAFAVYCLSQYYRVSKDPDALGLAREAFIWMEEHAHDPRFGGYFEVLGRDGYPLEQTDGTGGGQRGEFGTGMKDYNSSIHLMEAFTELYSVWPDSLVRTRLEEMFFLVRDTFIHPSGYLQLYFHPDWTLVTDEEMAEQAGEGGFFTNHVTYGHDVETAYLLLETARVLGRGEDEKTHVIAKKLVDHALASGWDQRNGGFFDEGKYTDDSISIINSHKAWWAQIEGLNALLLMYTLYPDDPNDYYGKFLKMWAHIDTYLIDKEFGGWYNSSLDTYPDNQEQSKSHMWKTTYHNSRGLVHCIEMLRSR